MPRSVRDSDDDTDIKHGQRTRILIDESVMNSPVRRSSRLKQQVRQDGHSPTNDSGVRVTRRRAGTLDSTVLDSPRTLRSRKISNSSDMSEKHDIDTETSLKRSTRRTSLSASSVAEAAKPNTRLTKQLVRAGSERKSPVPTQTPRGRRAASMDPVMTNDKSNEETTPPSKSARAQSRASVLPSEPVVEEENEDMDNYEFVDTDDVDDLTAPDISPTPSDMLKTLSTTNTRSNQSSSLKEKSMEKIEEHENSGNRSSSGSDISVVIIKDTHETSKMELKLNESSEGNSSQMKLIHTSQDSPVNSLEDNSVHKSGTGEVDSENIGNKSTEKQQRSPGNKENENINIYDGTPSKQSKRLHDILNENSSKPGSAKKLFTIKENVKGDVTPGKEHNLKDVILINEKISSSDKTEVEVKKETPVVNSSVTALNVAVDDHADKKPITKKRLLFWEADKTLSLSTDKIDATTSDCEDNSPKTQNNPLTKKSTEADVPVALEEDDSNVDKPDVIIISSENEVEKEKEESMQTDVKSSDSGNDKSKSTNDILPSEERPTSENVMPEKEDVVTTVSENLDINKSVTAQPADQEVVIIENIPSPMDTSVSLDKEKEEEISSTEKTKDDGNVSNFNDKTFDRSTVIDDTKTSDDKPEDKDTNDEKRNSLSLNTSTSKEDTVKSTDKIQKTDAKVSISEPLEEGSAETSVKENDENQVAAANDSREYEPMETSDIPQLETVDEPVVECATDTAANVPEEKSVESTNVADLPTNEKKPEDLDTDKTSEHSVATEAREVLEDSDLEMNTRHLFQDRPKFLYETSKDQKEDKRTSSECSTIPDKQDNNSETDCDLVLVDKEAWQAAEKLKTMQPSSDLEYDSDDTVELKALADSMREESDDAKKEMSVILEKSHQKSMAKDIEPKVESENVDSPLNGKNLRERRKSLSSSLNETNVLRLGKKNLIDATSTPFKDNIKSTRSSFGNLTSFKKHEENSQHDTSVKSSKSSKSSSKIVDEDDSSTLSACSQKKRNTSSTSLGKTPMRNVYKRRNVSFRPEQDEEDDSEVSEDETEELSNSKKLANYSKLAQVNSSSASNVDSESDSDDWKNESRKIPKFLFAQESDTSNDASDEKADGDSSMDSDIAREYNLAGRSDVKYSDDDVPGDDCRPSETESSDSEDDGTDLRDFIVDDDDVEDEDEEEEEGEVEEEEDGNEEEGEGEVDLKVEDEEEEEEADGDEEEDENEEEGEGNVDLKVEDEEVENEEEEEEEVDVNREEEAGENEEEEEGSMEEMVADEEEESEEKEEEDVEENIEDEEGESEEGEEIGVENVEDQVVPDSEDESEDEVAESEDEKMDDEEENDEQAEENVVNSDFGTKGNTEEIVMRRDSLNGSLNRSKEGVKNVKPVTPSPKGFKYAFSKPWIVEDSARIQADKKSREIKTPANDLIQKKRKRSMSDVTPDIRIRKMKKIEEIEDTIIDEEEASEVEVHVESPERKKRKQKKKKPNRQVVEEEVSKEKKKKNAITSEEQNLPKKQRQASIASNFEYKSFEITETIEPTKQSKKKKKQKNHGPKATEESIISTAKFQKSHLETHSDKLLKTRSKKPKKSEFQVTTNSGNTTAAVLSTTTREEILRAVEQTLKKIKSSKDPKTRHQEHAEKETKDRKMTSSGKSLKRLPSDIIEHLSDAPRPRKRQRTSKDSVIIPSGSSSTTKFIVVDLQKEDKMWKKLAAGSSSSRDDLQERNSKKSAAVQSFRQKMLAKNSRQPVSTYLAYLQKQKACDRGKFSGKPH